MLIISRTKQEVLMWTFQASANSKASPDTIWSLYSDVANWKRWDDAIITSDLQGQFEVGSKGSMTIEGNPRPLPFVLLEVEVNKLFRDVTEIPGVNIEFTHSLEQLPDGTKITHHVTISGPAWEQVAATVGKKLEHGLPQTVASLARLAESELAAT
jgi:Polyketide cyclase / dehydrase and lipid transport